MRAALLTERQMKSKVWSVILKIITVILALIVVYLVYVKVTGGIPQFFGYRILRVVSPSMEDTLIEGDYILVKNCDVSSIEAGDIITFYSSDPANAGLKAPITHRVVEKNDDGSFVTQGDNNEIKDKYPAEPENVIGIFEKKMPAVTWIVSQFSKPYIFLVIILVPLLIILSVRVTRIIRLSGKNKTDGSKGDDDESVQK